MKSILNVLGSSLIEQSWQISMVFGLVLVACWMLRNASAHWRYLLWLVVIGKCLMPPMVTVQLPLLPAEEGMTQQSTVTEATSPFGNADFESSTEIAKAPSLITQNTESVSMEFAAASSAAHEPTSLSHASFNLRDWFVTAWLLIVGILITHVAWRMWLTHRRLKRTCQPADAETQAVVVVLAETLGMKKTPAVHMADSFAQPFVWGWLRGDVYLPKTFPETGTVEQRRAILMHELAHVLRWDAAVNHLQNVVQAVFFFHPLIWWTNQKIRQEREKCCDEIVLSVSDTQPRVYCAAIVDQLAREYTSRQSTPALAVTGSLRNVKERITTMLTPHRKFLRRPSRVAVITVLFIAACVLPTALVMTPQTSNVVAQDEPAKPDAASEVANSSEEVNTTNPSNLSTWLPGQTMEFRVINADTKEPIPDVTLELQNMGPGIDFGDVKIQKTDADGWSRIPLPDLPPTAVRVYPVKEGFVPLRVIWEAGPHPTMPKSISILMEPARTFGGVVQNEAGEPVPDVTVTIDFWGVGKGENPHIRANIDAKTTTDKNGRWSVNAMPAEIDDVNRLRIYLHHPNYVSDHLRQGFAPIPVTERPPLDQLYDQSAVMVMREGEMIEGRVVDLDGKPIPNAAIYDREHYWFDASKQQATTDENGEFRIKGVEFSPNLIDFRQPRINNDRGFILTVQADGYAPELIFANPNSSPLEVQLDAGESVHGQVVDENSQPVEGVNVSPTDWRGQRSRLHLEVKTDADGRFELKNVPTDEVKYGMGKEGYMYVSDLPMTPSSEEYKVVLKAPVKIVGSVTDAETGKPLEKFTLIPGTDFEDGRNPFWTRWQSRTIVGEGRYETTFRQEEFSWRLRIEAEGYLPDESRIFRLYNPDKGEVTYDFKLTKAAPLTGIVLGLDDKPLANVDVYLATQLMNIANRKVTFTDVPPVKTDAAGRFQFPAEVEPFCIVVVHEEGIGMITEAECETPPTITIKAWESVKDQLQIIRKPAGMHRDFP